MKLKKATIFNYKTISSQTTLELEERVTALLGKSESGKTNVLEAINSLFVDQDYSEEQACSWLKPPNADDPVVRITCELEPHDVEALDPTGGVLAAGESMQLTRRWGGELVPETTAGVREEKRMPRVLSEKLGSLRRRCRSLWNDLKVSLSEVGRPPEYVDRCAQLTRSLLEDLGARKSEEDENIALQRASETARVLREAVVQTKTETGAADFSLLQRRASWLANDIERAQNMNSWETVDVPPFAISEVQRLLPIVQYVGSTLGAIIEDKAPLAGLRSRPEEFPLYVALLNLGGLSVSDLKTTNLTRLHRQLNDAEQTIGETLGHLWSQEPVEIHLSVVGDEMRVEFRGPEGHYGRPSQRSEGFLWFLSFYLRHVAPLSQGSNSSGRGLLLLDEPGLHLHASAQQDLLRLFERLADTVQVIYTTHSPFLVNKNYPSRIRQVDKQARPEGTRINNAPYHSQRGLAWEPVRTAIGVTAGNSLFIGGQNLVVEGISDQILLAAVSQRLTREKGQVFLDLEMVTICPADGAQSCVPLAHFCASCSDNAVVLLDNDEQGKKAAKRLEKAQVVQMGKVVVLGSDREKETTIEDLLDEDLYHEAVVTAYADLLDETARKDLPESRRELEQGLPGLASAPAVEGRPAGKQASGDRPTVHVYKQHWQEKSWGDFSKTLVAKRVAQMAAADQDDQRWQKTLDKFEQLFGQIDAAFSLPFKKPGVH